VSSLYLACLSADCNGAELRIQSLLTAYRGPPRRVFDIRIFTPDRYSGAWLARSGIQVDEACIGALADALNKLRPKGPA
jgi:hypothetical protein